MSDKHARINGNTYNDYDILINKQLSSVYCMCAYMEKSVVTQSVTTQLDMSMETLLNIRFDGACRHESLDEMKLNIVCIVSKAIQRNLGIDKGFVGITLITSLSELRYIKKAQFFS